MCAWFIPLSVCVCVCVCTVYFIPVFFPGKGRSKTHLSTSEDGTTESQNTGVARTVRGN